MPQDAALSWRYFSDIFASIGIISAPVPRYPEWAARETHSRGLKDLMFNKSPAEVHRNRGPVLILSWSCRG
jgi:hypothetical protein